MARPLVLVYQDLAQPQDSPTTPDLNTIVIGPAYDIFDYPDDAATILLSTAYGQLEQPAGNGTFAGYVPPVAGAVAVSVLGGAYPGQSAGSRVDHDSVAVTLRTPRVVLASTYANGGGVTLAGTVTTSASDQTLVQLTVANTTVAVGSNGLILPQGTLNVAATAGFPTAGTALVMTNLGQQLVAYTGTTGTTLTGCTGGLGTLATGNAVLASPTTDLLAAGIQAGDRIVLTSSQTANQQTVVATVTSVGEPNAAGLATDVTKLRISTNLPAAGTGASGWTYDANGEVRIERALATQSFVDTTGAFLSFPTPGADDFAVKGGITLSLPLTPAASVAVPTPATTTVARTLSYAQVYLAYRALKQSLQAPDSVSNADIVLLNGISNINPLGKIDARNPLAVGVFVALQNSGTAPIYYLGVPSDDAAGHASARSAIGARSDLYCEIPLTQDTSILAAYQFENLGYADPNQAATTGVAQKFRVAVGSAALPTSSVVYAGSISGVASQPSGALTSLNRTLDIANASNVNVTQLLPGDLVQIGLVPATDAQWQNRRGLHRVGHVNSSPGYPGSGSTSQFELVPGSTRWADTLLPAAPGDIELVVTGQDGTVKVSKLASASISTGAGGTLGTIAYAMKTPTLVGGPYTIQYVAVGGLLAVGVALAGFTITVSVDGTSMTHAQVAAAVNASATVGALVTASVTAGGTQIVVPASQATRTPLSGQAGVAASIVTGAGSGNVRVTGVTGMTVASVGHYLTISGANSTANNGQFLIAQYNSATSVDVVNGSGVTGDTNNGSIHWTETLASTDVTPVSGSCTASVLTNDLLFNQLTDASALFLTSGVKPGDLIELPVDPNNYGATAFAGSCLTFAVGQVLSENALKLANGLDDSDAAGNELPHYFERNKAGTFIDNTLPNALNYRIRRALTKDQQVSALIGLAAGFRSKRTTLVWPDQAIVAGLLDGSKPRAVPTVRAPAGAMPGWVLACQVGGALAGLPCQQGLTNLGLAGVATLVHSQDYFSEPQLAQISDGGWFVLMQRHPTDLPFCIHQLTTDITALETGELSVVKNADFISVFLQDICEPFLGQYNVLPETLQDIERALNEGAQNLISRRVAKIGPPLLSGSVTTIKVADFAADRIQVYFTGNIPRPLNTIELHIVF